MKKKSKFSPRSRLAKEKQRRSGDQGTRDTPAVEEEYDQTGEIIDDALMDLAVGDVIPTTSNSG
jgi:hypothetical protein